MNKSTENVKFLVWDNGLYRPDTVKRDIQALEYWALEREDEELLGIFGELNIDEVDWNAVREEM